MWPPVLVGLCPESLIPVLLRELRSETSHADVSFPSSSGKGSGTGKSKQFSDIFPCLCRLWVTHWDGALGTGTQELEKSLSVCSRLRVALKCATSHGGTLSTRMWVASLAAATSAVRGICVKFTGMTMCRGSFVTGA